MKVEETYLGTDYGMGSLSDLFRKVWWEDHLSPGFEGQPRQLKRTLSLIGNT